MKDILYLVIPCYNEQEVLDVTAEKLTAIMQDMIVREKISAESRILLVNDGSKDKTWEIIERLHGENELIQGLKLSRNKGHQNALLAGLMTAKERADMALSLDADLQDDVNAIERFVDKYYEGCDVVYGVRSSRKTDSAFKRGTAQGFYKIMKALGVDIVYNHADYRLMSKRALQALEQFKEVNLFLRGIVPLIGFRSDTVEYERNERFAGESKYPLKKMLAFAFDGITSFSIKPIRMISALGFLIALLAAVLFVVFFVQKLCGGSVVMGWASTICSIWLLGGLQLLAIGVVGEYIGKIYLEVKQRPKFIIEQYLD